MIITETVTISGQQYKKTYSDSGVKVHGGFPESDYDEVYDPIDSGRTYTETDIPIDDSEADATEILNILTGETP